MKKENNNKQNFENETDPGRRRRARDGVRVLGARGAAARPVALTTPERPV